MENIYLDFIEVSLILSTNNNKPNILLLNYNFLLSF